MNKLSFFRIKESYSCALIGLGLSTMAGILAYNLYFIYGYTNADGIIEGLTAFSNATWIISGCGRWLLAILFSISGNIVMPLPAVLGYCFLTWLSSYIIMKTWKMESCLSAALLSLTMAVTPASIIHFTYNAVAFPYAIALTLSAFYVYAVFQYKGVFGWLIPVICITCGLGIYQSYLGFSAALFLMTMVISLRQGMDLRKILEKATKALVCAFAGAVLYYIALQLLYLVTGLHASSRMADLSVGRIIFSLPSSIVNSYKQYFRFFSDRILQRHIIYLIIFILLMVTVFKRFREKNIRVILLSLFCIALIPVASNVVCLIMPNAEYSTSMTYQNILIIPFLIAMIEPDQNRIIKPITAFLCIFLVWTYIVSANATFHCFRLSYDYTYSQMSQVVYDIEHHEEYKPNETPVIVAGFFDDTILRSQIKTYRYAVDLPDNPVFWKTRTGVTYNRQKYFMNYFGLDFKDVEYDEYLKVVSSDEYAQMNVWPKENSIAKIGQYLVVKISAELPETNK
ncbi:MAG: glucosyltransferase domain-containing protein [Erysipelotrichaceae bacterium]|nr:glucosyltransferase domain-containing protein [Erysipelotrichaceae bacterium]